MSDDETTRLRALLEQTVRERDSLRAQLDTVAEAYRALIAGQTVPEYSGPVLSERGRAVLDRVWPRRGTAAERERDDLAATLETRTAEHALAMARVAELEAAARHALPWVGGLPTAPDATTQMLAARRRLMVAIQGDAAEVSRG